MSGEISTQAIADTAVAVSVKQLLAAGQRDLACERFSEIIERHQRRATRIAYYYLRDPGDVDEAVQDAFLKAFLHLSTFRDDLVFELWFTKIVVNGCLDRIKSRTRRSRWMILAADTDPGTIDLHATSEPSPEDALLAQERRACVAAAVDRLPDRQRSVVILSHFEGYTPREVSVMLGLNEATVRVHLFRAIRTLRRMLRGERWLAGEATRPKEVKLG